MMVFKVKSAQNYQEKNVPKGHNGGVEAVFFSFFIF